MYVLLWKFPNEEMIDGRVDCNMFLSFQLTFLCRVLLRHFLNAWYIHGVGLIRMLWLHCDISAVSPVLWDAYPYSELIADAKLNSSSVSSFGLVFRSRYRSSKPRTVNKYMTACNSIQSLFRDWMGCIAPFLANWLIVTHRPLSPPLPKISVVVVRPILLLSALSWSIYESKWKRAS